MPRARKGSARHRSRVRLRRAVKGYRGAPGRLKRLAQDAVTRAGVYARRDRRARKRDFRALWITRISAACAQRQIGYSRLICGLKAAGVELDRKMLSELAIHDPAAFDKIVETARASLPKAVA